MKRITAILFGLAVAAGLTLAVSASSANPEPSEPSATSATPAGVLRIEREQRTMIVQRCTWCGRAGNTHRVRVTRLTVRDESGQVAISERRVLLKGEAEIGEFCQVCTRSKPQDCGVVYLDRGHGHIITFDPQGGVMRVADGIDTRFVTVRITRDDDRLGHTLSAPTREGYLFHGWWTTPAEGGERFMWNDTTFDSDTTVYARWLSVEAQQARNITFDANGGVISGGIAGTTSITRITAEDGRFSSFPNANQAVHMFIGWFTAPEGGERVYERNTFTADMTLYAQWQLIRLRFDANGGEVDVEYIYVRDIHVLGLPTPTRENFEFLGWFRNGAQVTESSWFPSHATLTARWTSTIPGVFIVRLNIDRCYCPIPDFQFPLPDFLLTGTDSRLEYLPFPQTSASDFRWGRFNFSNNSIRWEIITTSTVFTDNGSIRGYWGDCTCYADEDDYFPRGS